MKYIEQVSCLLGTLTLVNYNTCVSADKEYPDSPQGPSKDQDGKATLLPPPDDGTNQNSGGKSGGQAANRFSKRTKTKRAVKRTMAPRLSFFVDCDILAYSCLKGYVTGMVCARTVQHEYETFSSYCAMDYMNCIEKQTIWQLMFMGECSKTYEELAKMGYYIPYPYIDDYHLDLYYVNE